jgi:hypothetical protein
MGPLCKDLIKKWNEGLVILSPRDMELDQMKKLSKEIRKSNGEVVLDPQFYIPRADHYRLISHSFWPSQYDSALFNRSDVNLMLTNLKHDYNDVLETKFFILPGLFTDIVNDDWFNFQSILLEEAKKIEKQKDIYITLCLSKELMNNESDLHDLLEYLEDMDYEGCYLVPEPSTSYLIQDPAWLLNLLDLTAGLKLKKKKVIVGYSNHQHLILALSKIDGIASGNWLNTRNFNTQKFNNPEGGNGRRSKWYYCPQALTEYQIPFLDIAKRLGMLDNLRTNPTYNSNFSDILFSGAQPTSVNYGERDSFAHYLHCLKKQTNNAVKNSFVLTKNSLNMEIETAILLTEEFSRNGISGRDRDYGNIADINLSAIAAFNVIRGLSLTHNWNKI